MSEEARCMDGNGQLLSCDRVCMYHESRTSRIATMEEQVKKIPGVCVLATANANLLGRLQTTMHVAAAVIGSCLAVFLLVASLTYQSLAETDAKLADKVEILDTKSLNRAESNDTKIRQHEREVADSMSKTLIEVRELKWSMTNRMSSIEHKQGEIEGSNKYIIKMLEAVIKDQGIVIRKNAVPKEDN